MNLINTSHKIVICLFRLTGFEDTWFEDQIHPLPLISSPSTFLGSMKWNKFTTFPSLTAGKASSVNMDKKFNFKTSPEIISSSYHCICSWTWTKTQKHLKIFTGHEPSIWLSQQVKIFIFLKFLHSKTPTVFGFVFWSLFSPYSINKKQKGHFISAMNLLLHACFWEILSDLTVLEKSPNALFFIVLQS